jgi:hypothetical protein
MMTMKKSMCHGPAVLSTIWYKFSQASCIISRNEESNAQPKLSNDV